MKIFYSAFITLCMLLFISACRPPDVSKFETRAVWMSRFEYAQDKNTKESQKYIHTHFKKFRDAGINVIIFQVRGNADAFYKSNYEPWSQLLSDSLGQNPSWDPLEYALVQAHQLGLELHAWVNTFPAWRANDPPPAVSQPLHPLLAHPEWVVCDSAGNPMKPENGYITFSPGIPEVQAHVQRVVMDIVTNYDIDGMHFDYIRYPESSPRMGYSHDSISVRRLKSDIANPGHFPWESFQREQINQFVETVYNKIEAEKPWIKVSAAVIGHHHDADWNGYHAVFQDARRWMAIGKIDIVFLMTYQKIGHPTAPFEGALKQWNHMLHLGRQIIPGIATYRVGQQFKWGDIWDQIELIRQEKFPGMVFFSANSLARALDELREEYYPLPALTSPLPWKKNIPGISISDMNITFLSDSLQFSWQFTGDPHCFVLYHKLPVSDPNNILAIVPGDFHVYQISQNKVVPKYYLTAVNRAGIESEPIAFPQLPIAETPTLNHRKLTLNIL